MKKTIFVIALLAGTISFISAQQESRNVPTTTKNGHPILPAAGDFALGIDAVPFLKYGGNMLNGNLNNAAPSFDGVNQQIYGKYFLTDRTALRGRLKFDFGTDQHSQAVPQDDADPLNPDKTVLDYQFANKGEITLHMGYEMRRGYRRLQGFYGAELGIGFTNNTTTYKYGNVMTMANQLPTSYNFKTNKVEKMGNRPLAINNGMQLQAGVNGFVGVEYFVAPKISIGGELGVGLYGKFTNVGTSKSEAFNGSSNAVEEHAKRVNGALSPRHLHTITTGSLFVMFHF